MVRKEKKRARAQQGVWIAGRRLHSAAVKPRNATIAMGRDLLLLSARFQSGKQATAAAGKAGGEILLLLLSRHMARHLASVADLGSLSR